MAEERPSGAAVGFTLFAGVMMMIIGVQHALWGFSALLKDEFFVVTPNYLYDFDISVWGWIHLIAGVVIFIAAFAVYAGSVWARSVGVFLAAISLIANFMTIPYYPVWSIVLVALDVFVIWALTVHGRDVTRT